MARPIKNTVDYFPHIIKNGKTIFILESKFGNDGYAFWFKLLELLGSSDNHVYDFNNSVDWEFLIAKTNVSEEKVTEILKTLVDVEAIDRELLKNKVIWCENFVKGIEDVYRKRKQNRPQKPVIDDGNPSTPVVSVAETPQRKLKEIKVNKTKEKREYAPAVFLTEEEYQKLVTELGDPLTKEYMKDLSLHIQSKGKEKYYKSHYATILAWHRKDEKEGKVRKPQDSEDQQKYIPKQEPKFTPEQIKENLAKNKVIMDKLKSGFNMPEIKKGTINV